MSIQQVPKIDCHGHILDPAGFPYNPASPFQPAGQEIATAAQMIHVHEAHGVVHALLVQPNSGYAGDNCCMLAAIAAGGDRFKGVAVVPHDISTDALADLKARGIVGAAFNLPFFPRGYYEGTEELLEKLAALDMFLQVQVEGDQLLDILPMLRASGVKLLFDHCGRPLPRRGIDQPGFQALLGLGHSGRASVKLSGFIKFSEVSHPFPDTWPYLRALLDAFGPEACVWGSDWPFLRARERVDYGPLVAMTEGLLPDPAVRRAVLWETPCRLFGFSDT